MSLGQWLNNRIAQPAPVQPSWPQASAPTATAAAHSLSEIHQRLDGITRQIDQMSQRRAGGARHRSGLANQLNDAISRLDTRLSNLAHRRSPAPGQPQLRPASIHDAIERAATEIRQAPRYHTSPPLSPAGLDAAIAEISARRHSLNDGGAYACGAEPVHAACAAAGACPRAPAACRRRSVRNRAPAQQPDQPDGGAAPPRSSGSVDRGLPRGTRRNPPLADRGAAAPGDRFARERNPRAGPEDRAQPRERRRSGDARRHRARAERNLRRGAHADAGGAARGLRHARSRISPARSICWSAPIRIPISSSSSRTRSPRCATSQPMSPRTTRSRI